MGRRAVLSHMQFHIDVDQGSYITGWVLPDNPSATPSIAISVEGGTPVLLQANVFRKDLKDLGVHHTGMLGFEIHGSMVPGLESEAQIEIREVETNFLIHRRFRQNEHLAIKVLFCDLSTMPQLPIEASIGSHFALHYKTIERYSFDTLFSIVNNQSTSSVCLTGRPHLTRYLQLLRDRNYRCAAMLRDPIEELAEKLIFLKFSSTGRAASFVSDYLTGMAPLTNLAQRLDIADDNSIASNMNSLSNLEIEALANPFVRILGCAADEFAQPYHVSIALENLANLDLVGIRSRFDAFRDEWAGILGGDLIGELTPATISSVPALAAKLSKLRSVHKLLALDIKLYRFALEAFEKVYDRPAQVR
jgi:hypothetical protein